MIRTFTEIRHPNIHLCIREPCCVFDTLQDLSVDNETPYITENDEDTDTMQDRNTTNMAQAFLSLSVSARRVTKKL